MGYNIQLAYVYIWPCVLSTVYILYLATVYYYNEYVIIIGIRKQNNGIFLGFPSNTSFPFSFACVCLSRKGINKQTNKKPLKFISILYITVS